MRESVDGADAETEYEMCKKPSPERVSSLVYVSPSPDVSCSNIKGQLLAVGECDCSYVHGRRSLTNCLVQATFERDIKSSFVQFCNTCMSRHEIVGVFMYCDLRVLFCA